ncbi:MAG: hypothetical protein ABJF01_25825 [bacterium]
MTHTDIPNASPNRRHRRRRPAVRSKAKLIRLTEEEWERIVTRARDCGRPVACFMRESALDGAPRARRGHVTSDLVVRLGKVALQLQALSQAAGARGLPAGDFDRAVDEVLASVRELG